MDSPEKPIGVTATLTDVALRYALEHSSSAFRSSFSPFSNLRFSLSLNMGASNNLAEKPVIESPFELQT